MDSFRKQLDALMGANRNGDVTEVKRKYYDRDVCRLYLAGLCPHDLFQLTKMDLGACSKIHSLQLRKEYEDAKAKGIDNYDREMEDVLERHIGECERKITRALRRLEDDDAKAATAISVSEVTKSTEVEDLTKQIKQKLKEAEYLDLEGRSDDKIRIMDAVEELRAKRADKQAMLLLEAFNKDRASMPQPVQTTLPLAPLPLTVITDARTQEMIMEKLKKAEELGELGRVDEAQKLMEEAEALKKLGAQEVHVDNSKSTAVDVRIEERNKARKLLDDERLRDRASSRDRERAHSRDRERDLLRERDKGYDRRSRERDHDHRSRERDHDRKREHSGDYSSHKRSRSRSQELSRDRSDHYRRHDKYDRY